MSEQNQSEDNPLSQLGIEEPSDLSPIEYSELREAEEDQRYFQRRMGGVMFHKVITPKGKASDIMIGVDVDAQDSIPTIIAEPFRAHVRHSIPSPLYSFAATIKTPDLKYSDQMFSSTIIGWTAELGQTCLVNRTQLGTFAKNIEPMTDTIFPVFVMGSEEKPVFREVLDRDIMAYEPGMYLALGHYQGLGTFTVEIEVQKGKTSQKFRAMTCRSKLELYCLYLNWKDSQQIYLRSYQMYGIIDRILDKDNTTYGIYGMYAGGPIPTPLPSEAGTGFKSRICWDQPIDFNAEDFALQSLKAGFRFDIDYQKGSRRTGFFCSRDALLVVNEVNRYLTEGSVWLSTDPKGYRSLLKESTYLIVDGFSGYGLFHSESDTEKKMFTDIDSYSLGPIMVIVQEGVNTINVLLNHMNPNYRMCRFFNENPVHPPLMINWREVQTSFSIGVQTRTFSSQQPSPSQSYSGAAAPPLPTPAPTGIKQIMSLREFNDFHIFPIVSLQTELVFTLKQKPNFFPQENRWDEYWHVYCRLSPQDLDPIHSIYYYLGTISNSYHPMSGYMEYIKTFFQRRLFPIEINPSLYPFVTPQQKQLAQEMAYEWNTMSKNYEFVQILNNLIEFRDQINNPSIYSHSRQIKINLFLKS